MEVTKYYCELCGKEIGYREWTEIVVAVRSYIPHRNDVITCSRKMCDDCLKEVGLMEENQLEPSTVSLYNKYKFKNILKKLLKKED